MTRAIVVTSGFWRSTRATMRLDQRARKQDPGRLVRGPMPARLPARGRDGLRLLAPRLAPRQRDLPAPADRRPDRWLRVANAPDLVAVLRWLRPGTRIAMGPASWLTG